jgi:hypothetical protein
MIDSLAAPPRVGVKVLCDSITHRKWPGPDFMSLFSSLFGFPPCARCALGLRVIKNQDAVGILKIISDAYARFDVVAIKPSTTRKPCAARATPPIAKRKTSFEATPIRLAANCETQSRCVSPSLRHEPFVPSFASDFWEFFGRIRRRIALSRDEQ